MPIVLLLVLLAALGVTLAHSQPQLRGTNSVPQRMQYIGLQHGEEACQGSQLMPAGAGHMRMFIWPGGSGGTTPKASMKIFQAQDGRVASSRGHLVHPDSPDAWVPPGLPAAPTMMDFPIDPPVRNTRTDAYVCIRNTGAGPINLRGVLTKFGNVQFHNRKLDIALTMLWFDPHRRTWVEELGSIVPRVGRARLGGTWPFWAATLLMLAAFAAALVTVIRESTR